MVLCGTCFKNDKIPGPSNSWPLLWQILTISAFMLRSKLRRYTFLERQIKKILYDNDMIIIYTTLSLFFIFNESKTDILEK